MMPNYTDYFAPIVDDGFYETLKEMGHNPFFVVMHSSTDKPYTELTPTQWEELNKVATW